MSSTTMMRPSRLETIWAYRFSALTRADASFAEALKYYKNEFSVFSMMAKAMLEAGEYVRALGHVRKGLKERPEDAELLQLAEECLRLRAQAGR